MGDQGWLVRESEYTRKVKAAAEREMERELALARCLGFLPRQAALSERFMDAQDARRQTMKHMEWLEGSQKILRRETAQDE